LLEVNRVIAPGSITGCAVSPTSCVQRVASLPRDRLYSDSIACSSRLEASGRMSGEMKNCAKMSRAWKKERGGFWVVEWRRVDGLG